VECTRGRQHLGRMHQTLGSQLRLVQADGKNSPGCAVYSKRWRRCDGVVALFIEKMLTFIILLLRLRLVGLGLGLVLGLGLGFSDGRGGEETGLPDME